MSPLAEQLLAKWFIGTEKAKFSVVNNELIQLNEYL